jgi:sensor c-di-GMP phosphodiesterase-like protein
MLGAILLALLLGQAVLYFADKRHANSLAEQAQEHATSIAHGRKIAAAEVEQITHDRCSEADIKALKSVVFGSTYMSDVGRLEGNKLLCSALWGKVNVSLPSPRYTVRGLRFWNASDLSGTPYEGTTLIAEGNAFVVASPSTFEEMDPARSSVISIETRDRDFTYRKISTDNRIIAASHSVHAKRCGDGVNSCVFVTSPRRMLWDLSLPTIAIVLVTGIFLGLLLTYYFSRHHRVTRKSIQKRFMQAIKGGELKLVYQPLRRISDNTVVGFEALSRWKPRDEEEISPAFFVPIALQLGLSPELFRHVLTCALREMAPILQERRDIYVSINVEAIDLVEAEVISHVADVVKGFGVNPNQIRFELTERDESCSKIQANIQKLANAGFKFLIDDFGTGRANFSHLAQSPFIGIKIDRMFTSAVDEDSPLRPVLPAICNVADELGLEIIAEGVETADQAAALRSMSPEIVGQGWYFGHPLPCEHALQELQ